MSESPNPTTAKPQRWLVVQASALLEAVSTSNYACYGRGGVPRYPIVRPATGDSPDPAELCVEMRVLSADGTLRLASLDLTLKQHEKSEQRAVWIGYIEAQRLQVIWIWDFYRIQSHIVLREGEPPPDLDPDAAWKDALEAVRGLAAGDTIAFDVRSACGDIHQAHTLTSPAKPWEPGK